MTKLPGDGINPAHLEIEVTELTLMAYKRPDAHF